MDELFDLEKEYGEKFLLLNQLKNDMNELESVIQQKRELYNREKIKNAQSYDELKKINTSLSDFQNQLIEKIERGKPFIDSMIDVTDGYFVYFPYAFTRHKYKIDKGYYLPSSYSSSWFEGFYLYYLENGYVFHPAVHKEFANVTLSRELKLKETKKELKNGNYIKEDLHRFITDVYEYYQKCEGSSWRLNILQDTLKKLRLRKLFHSSER